MRNTKWSVKELPDNSKIENIDITEAGDISVDRDVLKILYSRGIRTEEEIRKFLNPALENIQNPYDLYDMEKAVTEIESAVKDGKNIWVYGDYDVDGITSTSILYLALKEIGAENVSYYIPLRDEGYGLNKDALKRIKDSGADILITVDCGITAFEEIEYAGTIGLPVIVTDHHNLNGKKVPDALAVVNPKRRENSFRFQNLAGVGTIFMVILCLYEKIGKKEEAYKFLDLVSIGTIADIVPLVEENRILAKFGLEQLPYSHHKGLKYLIYKLFNHENAPKTEFTTYDVGFIIAPVFNAAGRLKDAKMVVKLLISDNNREIETIVTELINRNYERKELQNSIVEKIEKNIKEKSLSEAFVIVDYAPEYHHGVIGIAASKIVDTYYKPAIVMELKEDEGVAVGSCRSIENFNILEALQSMPELFIKFGGHSGAAGFTIPVKNIELFRKKINAFAEKRLTEEDFVKVINIDKRIPIQKVSYEFFKVIELMKPFGFGNQMPTFQTRNVILQNMRLIGENKSHAMFDLEQKGFLVRNAVWFNSGEYFNELNSNTIFDIVYKLKLEYYQDRYYVKVYVEDMKISRLKDDKLNYYYSMHSTSFPLKSVFYTNLDVEKEMKLTAQEDFEGLILYSGRKFIGRMDTGISNLLILLNRYYGWNFKIEIEKITKTVTHNIVEIVIERDYSFECFDYSEAGIFKKIKNFLIGNMEYSSYTRKLLSAFYKDEKNLIVESGYQGIDMFLLTLGIYYFYKYGKKSQIAVKNMKKNPYNTKFIRKYFNINEMEEIDRNAVFTVFYGFENEKEVKNIIKEYSMHGKTESGEPKDIWNGEFKADENAGGKELEVAENTEDAIIKEKAANKVRNLEAERRFCIVLGKNFGVISEEISGDEKIRAVKEDVQVPENAIFLNNLKKEERKNLKNIYVEYLPFEEKIKLKKKLEAGKNIYCDGSIFEIL